MPSFQITERIKQDVRNARFIGEFTVKIGAQKLPGIIWGVVSRVRNSVYPESVPRVRPEENESVAQASAVPVTPVPARDGTVRWLRLAHGQTDCRTSAIGQRS